MTGISPGLEYLLDGVMLPRLQSLHRPLLSFFVAFASRANQMKTLNAIDRSVLVDQLNDNERCFSSKQWHIVFDVLPCLRILLIQTGSSQCPPIELAEVLISYIKRTTRLSLTLFSCSLLHSNDEDRKENFVNYLLQRVANECSDVQFLSNSSISLDMWM